MDKTICELFAGVGGFRLGFERQSKDWKTVWFSQWEPGASHQWAHDCYVQHWGDVDENTGIDIASVDKKKIPSHNLLVGGFPCQDYSVAHSLKSSHGIEGKKGVLWWQINEILEKKKPAFVLLENVDRLIKSPAKQRGRDFGIMLACFAQLGYVVEWRVVNAAEYGAAQRRRRIFIFAHRKSTKYSKRLLKNTPEQIICQEGLFPKSFPIQQYGKINHAKIDFDDLVQVSQNFKFLFDNAGFMSNGEIYCANVEAKKETFISLSQILETNVESEYSIADKLDKWKYLKGAKKLNRTTKDGHKYTFSEGAISFPDVAELPARTMLTSEGTLNRSSHVVKDATTKQLRILTPVETERIQGFDDNWTNTGMPKRMRYFCMGNALVVPMITRMAKYIGEIFDEEQ